MTRRLFIAIAFFAAAACAGPPLTTVQDVLYKADGTRFNGTVTISWNSFQAADNSAIETQSISTRVIDGILRVQLVPTTTANPPAAYSVIYNSDGRIQFQETWSVPSSTTPLHLRDVRVATPVNPAADSGGGTSGPVQESDVVGLIADLGSRPVKGPGFAPGRVAIIDPSGAIESAAGNPADCVHVDGSSGACGSQPPSFVDADSPSGIVDGSNALFVLSAPPDPAGSLSVYRNGMLQKSGQDYTLTGSTIQFVAAATPQPGDTLLASYRLSGTDSASGRQIYPNPQVLCSGTGASTASAAFTSVGTCAIPAGVLLPGDRVEIRFDFAHQGAASGVSFAVLWGATTITQADAPAAERLITGRADAALLNAGAQLSSQSWGSALPFSASVATAPDDYSNGITISFQGKASQPGDLLTLGNVTVVRFP